MAAKRRNAKRRAPTFREQLQARFDAVASHGRRITVLVAAVVLVGLGMKGLSALTALPVERIVVGGKLEGLQQEALREALAVHVNEGLLRLNLRELRGEIEALPWVYQAQVRRRFPDTLEVQVVEQLPIARWGDDGFLNHEAEVIAVRDTAKWQALPLIAGPDGSEARLMGRYLELLEALQPLGTVPVTVTEDSFEQLAVTFDDGMEVNFGDRDFALRLQRFLQLWGSELAQSERAVAKVDMRYSGGAAVAFDEVAQIAALTGNSEAR